MLRKEIFNFRNPKKKNDFASKEILTRQTSKYCQN